MYSGKITPVIKLWETTTLSWVLSYTTYSEKQYMLYAV